MLCLLRPVYKYLSQSSPDRLFLLSPDQSVPGNLSLKHFLIQNIQFLFLDDREVKVQILLTHTDQNHSSAICRTINTVLECRWKSYCFNCHIESIPIRNSPDFFFQFFLFEVFKNRTFLTEMYLPHNPVSLLLYLLYKPRHLLLLLHLLQVRRLYRRLRPEPYLLLLRLLLIPRAS